MGWQPIDLAATFDAANRCGPAVLGVGVRDTQTQLVRRIGPQIFAVVRAVHVFFVIEALHRIRFSAVGKARRIAWEHQRNVA